MPAMISLPCAAMPAQLVQFRIHPSGDNLALAYLGGPGRPRVYGPASPEAPYIHLSPWPSSPEGLFYFFQDMRLDRQQLTDTSAQLHHLPGRDTARGHPGEYALHITHIRYPVRQRRGQFPVSEQGLHRILPGRYLLQVLDGMVSHERSRRAPSATRSCLSRPAESHHRAQPAPRAPDCGQ